MHLLRRDSRGVFRWFALGCLLVPMTGWAQGVAAAATGAAAEPGFAAVSIKPSNIGRPPFFVLLRDDSDVYLMRNVPLMLVVMQAYLGESTSDRSRIKGAPAWAMTERYDIQIKLDDAAMAAWKGLSRNEKVARMAPLLRQMLTERCKLVAHTVPVEVDGLVLERDKGGARLTPTPEDGSYPAAIAAYADELNSGMNNIGHGGKALFPPGMGGTGFLRGTMDDVVDLMRSHGIPVSNQTGLTGSYDLVIPVDPEPPVETGAPPDLFISRPEEFLLWHWKAVGLKLRQTKVTALQVVVDHMERPTPN